MIEGFTLGSTKLTYNILKHYLSDGERWFDHPKEEDQAADNFRYWKVERNFFDEEIQFVRQMPEYQVHRTVLEQRFGKYTQNNKDRIQSLYENRYFPIVQLEFERSCLKDRNLEKLTIGSDNVKVTLNLKRRCFFIAENGRLLVLSPNGVHIFILMSGISKNASQDQVIEAAKEGRIKLRLITAYISKKRVDDRSDNPQSKKQDDKRTKDDLERFLCNIRDVRSGLSSRIH